MNWMRLQNLMNSPNNISFHEIDNVYAVDMEGNIIWRIQNKERVCPEYKFISPYVMINYIDGELIVNDFNGFRFVFSPDDGTFVKRIQSLRPW